MNQEKADQRLQELETVSKMVSGSPYSAEQVGVIQRSVAKGTTISELAYFLNVCQSVGLNPFNKEVWCYKDHKGNLIIFTGRDGLLRKAQDNPKYSGIRSSEVRENDVFSMDIANNKIVHEFGLKERGKIIGAYAIVFREGGEPTIEWAVIDDFKPKNPNPYSPWAKFEAAMIKKVAEAHALKKAFGMTGVQIDEDWDVVNGKAIPRGTKTEKRSAEWEQLNRFLEEASDKELAQADPDVFAKYEDLKARFDERLDEALTKDIEADEV